MSEAAPSAVIVGPGAIGGWLAALLHDAGWTVKLLARGAALVAVRADGLIYQAHGRSRALPLQASDDPAALGVADYVVITLKGQALPEVGPRLSPLIGPQTALVSGMNGIPWWYFDGFDGPLEGQSMRSVDPDGALMRLFPVSRVIGAVVHAAAVSEAPGRVRLTSDDRLTFGEPDGTSTPRLRRLVEACRGSGMNTIEASDIRRQVWAKLWGNMCMNPLSALTRASTNRMLDEPEVYRLCAEMMTEMAGLGRELGIDLGLTPVERMAMTRKLGDLKTSMLQDMKMGRPLEIDGLLGVLIEIAERLDRPVPFLRAIYGLTRVLSESITRN